MATSVYCQDHSESRSGAALCLLSDEVVWRWTSYLDQAELVYVSTVSRSIHAEVQRWLYSAVVLDKDTDYKRLLRFALTVSLREEYARMVKLLAVPSDIAVPLGADEGAFLRTLVSGFRNLVGLRSLHVRNSHTLWEPPERHGHVRLPLWLFENSHHCLSRLHDNNTWVHAADNLLIKYLLFLTKQDAITDLLLSMPVFESFDGFVDRKAFPFGPILPNIRTVELNDARWLNLVDSLQVERVSLLIMDANIATVIPLHICSSIKHLRLRALDNACLLRTLVDFSGGACFHKLQSLTVIYDADIFTDNSLPIDSLLEFPPLVSPSLTILVLCVCRLHEKATLHDAGSFAAKLSQTYTNLQQLVVALYTDPLVCLDDNNPLIGCIGRHTYTRSDTSRPFSVDDEMLLHSDSWRTMSVK